jgi:hypothetical protein
MKKLLAPALLIAAFGLSACGNDPHPHPQQIQPSTGYSDYSEALEDAIDNMEESQDSSTLQGYEEEEIDIDIDAHKPKKTQKAYVAPKTKKVIVVKKPSGGFKVKRK